jgi:flagellin-like protein
MAFKFLSSNRKGMSPLIATVLLIAFAVALGAMIINIGSNIPAAGPDCSQIILDMSPGLCYKENTIMVGVTNNGQAGAESLNLKITDGSGDTTKELPDSALPSRGVFTRDVAYLKTGNILVSLIPKIKDKSGSLVPCPESQLQIKGYELPSC